MKLIKQIDTLIEARSLLKHPFYQKWSDGKLSLDSLTGYSKEYFQLVESIPAFMDLIIEKAPISERDELIANQQEEKDHIIHWVNFAKELGVSEVQLQNHKPLKKTSKAISELYKTTNTFEGGACAMYAFEKEIPKISQTKLEGLSEFYGISQESAIEYFKLHTEADIRHAATWKNIIEKSTLESENLIQISERSISAQNLLLDGCYEAYC